jgi:CO/xanthine dehydrogenase FAD-binding subunit
MLTFKHYYQPTTIDEAYKLFVEKEKSEIIGGCIFLRLLSREIENAVDIYKCGLNFIKETDDTVEIGAMTTYGDLERSEIIKNNFNGIIIKAIEHIVGIQLRNIISVGGTIVPKYGFSDLITALMALETKLHFYKSGEILLTDYINSHKTEKDILTKISINKTKSHFFYSNFKKSNNDYSVLNISLKKDAKNFKIYVGSRPKIAKLAEKASSYISENEINHENIIKASEIAAEELDFSTDIRAGKVYRKELCKTLVERIIMEVVK